MCYVSILNLLRQGGSRSASNNEITAQDNYPAGERKVRKESRI